MANDVVLSASIRTNLLALQNTAEMQAKIQERLATGKKVNSALDNATNFFTAASLNRRSTDLSSLLDGMSNGIKTLQAADNGIKSITKVIESMQANIRQARSDKSYKGTSFAVDSAAITASGAVQNLAISGGAVTGTVNVALNSAATNATLTGSGGFSGAGSTIGGSPAAITIQAAGLNGGAAVSVGTLVAGDTAATAVTKINTALNAATGGNGGITASVSGGQIVFTNTSGNNVTLGGDNTTLTAIGFNSSTRVSSDGVPSVAKTVDQLVDSINTNAALTDKVKASNDGGKLRIENLSTEDLSVVGASSTAVNGGTGNSNTQTVGANTVRKNLISQFNDLRAQLDKLSADASFNGINLLRGDKLKLNFNESGTSSIEIQAKDVNQQPITISTDANSMNVGLASSAEFSSDDLLNKRDDALRDALTFLQTQASSFGANLSTVQIRQDFTKQMINTLQSGADNLTLADPNEEGANLLALNTRQQLSQTALSLSNQASQAVLRLFG